MSKPMSDGGKGSSRRNEDSEAYRNNYDAIFGKKDKKMNTQDGMDPQERSDEDYERSEEGEWTCDYCGGPMYRQAHWSYAQCDDCGTRVELEDDSDY